MDEEIPHLSERLADLRAAIGRTLSDLGTLDCDFDVFISYRRLETESLALALYDYLRRGWHPVHNRRKLRVFLDFKCIRAGTNFHLAIQDAIRASASFLVLLSPTYSKTEFTSFEEMLITGSDPAGLQRRIVPILVAASEIPERLRPIQYFDWTARSPLSVRPERIRFAPGNDPVRAYETTPEWPTARGSSSRTATIAEPLSLPLKLLWSCSSQHTLNAEFVMDDVALYATEAHLKAEGSFSHSELAAWAIDSGREHWRIRFSGYLRSSPAIASAVLCAAQDASYFDLSDKSNIFGINTATGDILWQATMGTHIDADVLPFGDDFVVAGHSGEAMRIDARSGTVRWHHDITGAGLESQLSATPDGGLLVVNNRGVLEHIDALSGSPNYRVKLFAPQEGEHNHIAVDADEAFYAVEDTVFAVDWRNGRIIWKSGGHGGMCMSLSVDSRRVYGIGCEPLTPDDDEADPASTVFALDRRSGDIVWLHSTGHMLGTHVSPPVVIGDCVWIVIGGAELLALDAATGKRRWSAPGRYYSGPAKHRKTIVVGRFDGFDAYCAV
jgi:outer membrane protein assembly factor BamB